jgi:hypothetical protein
MSSQVFVRRLAIFLVSGITACLLAARATGQGEPASSAATHSAGTHAGWQIYRNLDYGFSIEYPEDVTVFAGHPDYTGMQTSYHPICFETTVACIEYTGSDYKGTNLEAAGIAIDILRDKRTREECDKIDESRAANVRKINGLEFHYGLTGTAGMNQSEGGPSYRHIYQGVCFEIAVGIATFNTGAVGDPGDVKELTSAELEQRLDSIVGTFRFIGPVKDGARWMTYYDDGCGGHFEYPDGDSVLQTIPFFNQRFNSDQITCSEYFSDHGLDYTIATEVGMDNPKRFEEWLNSSVYAKLDKARVVWATPYFTEYQAGPYYYLLGQEKAVIFSVSDSNGKEITVGADRVFDHLLASFKP